MPSHWFVISLFSFLNEHASKHKKAANAIDEINLFYRKNDHRISDGVSKTPKAVY